MSRSEPLQWQHMSRSQQRDANRVMSDFNQNLPSELGRQAELARNRDSHKRENATKAKRMDHVASGVVRKTASINQAAQNRVDLVKDAARGPNRLPGENIAGAGWYLENGKRVAEAAPDYEPGVAFAASSALSPGTDPAKERDALSALGTANARGSVTMDGKTTPFRDIPAKDIPGLVERGRKGEVTGEDVDFAGLSKTMSNNLPKATGILRGDIAEPQDPVKNPKTWSYAEGLRLGAEASPEVAGEYQHRMGVLGDKIRGDVGVGQGSLDLYGLQNSNEGLLSNQMHTAEDSWQQTISQRHRFDDESVRRVSKGISDVTLGAKGDAFKNDTSVQPESIQHAWNNEATQRAARGLQEEFQTEFTIPSIAVQETGWTAVRRDAAQSMTKPNATADKEYNAAIKPEKPAVRETQVKSGTKWTQTHADGTRTVTRQDRMF